MSRVRPRPVDVYKPLQIHYGLVDDKELRYEDENGFMHVVSGGQGGPTETAVLPKPEEIVVQETVVREEYATEPHEKFKRGNAYIKQKKLVDPDRPEYVVEDDDMEWVEKYNEGKAKDKEITYDLMELMIDRFERAAMGGTLELATALKLQIGRKQVAPELIEACFNYWQAKRGKLGNTYSKSLLFRYRTLKNNDDPDPNVVFRPREKEYQTRKKTRKNDRKSFQRMVELRLNLERAHTILELMKQREKLKKDRIQLMQQAFEVQLQMLQRQAKEDPTAAPEVHQHFIQEREQRRPERRPPPPVHQFNPYEKGFLSRDRVKKPRLVELESENSYMSDGRESALRPKSGGKLKPQKKRVQLPGGSHRGGSGGGASTAQAQPVEGARPPPVMRVVRSLVNKDNAPVDFHQVHDSGKFMSPIANGDRAWSTFRYTSRGRIGRGGRIIFDRTMVKDKLEDPKYGVDMLDWNIADAATILLQSQNNEDTCVHLLKKRSYDEFTGEYSDYSRSIGDEVMAETIEQSLPVTSVS